MESLTFWKWNLFFKWTFSLNSKIWFQFGGPEITILSNSFDIILSVATDSKDARTKMSVHASRIFNQVFSIWHVSTLTDLPPPPKCRVLVIIIISDVLQMFESCKCCNTPPVSTTPRFTPHYRHSLSAPDQLTPQYPHSSPVHITGGSPLLFFWITRDWCY